MNGPRPPDAARGDGGDIAKQNREKLLAEFGPVVDESLIFLIANERDLVKDYDEISAILNGIAEPARAEAATGFDPSGLSSLADLEGLRLSDETTTSANGVDSLAEYATTTSEFSDQPETKRLTEQTNLSDEQKIQELKLVFQDRWRDNTLKYMLKQSGGNLERAFDELLNRQFLEESNLLPKGVDGFAAPDPDENFQRRKGKGGRAQKGSSKSKKQILAVNYKAVSSTVDDQELEGAGDFVRPAGSLGPGSARHLPSPSAAARPSPVSSPTGTDFGAASLRAAAKLRRMGPLARQGAVVYTERAREEWGAFTAHASRTAESHVAQQSTATMLDLHGVFVMDGVRIAKQRVWAWWNGLGEDRKALARHSGFTVVTGVGKHSAGGVSRLRQVVGAYLKNDGWKVETLTGRFYITGRG
ncbi:hypothetical protein C8A00DRAFT_31443 [Chaetomidium leptoderma]|uniref:Smr domain-containing protein n=1 Tax=Chaetomidium leptoderma TaxID=669021 RepID=A0AAN6ZZ98_9PEZI|nr:hypothetical protein C8A00DRAFT_31443 [Chaetomidium leptoderma]